MVFTNLATLFVVVGCFLIGIKIRDWYRKSHDVVVEKEDVVKAVVKEHAVVVEQQYVEVDISSRSLK